MPRSAARSRAQGAERGHLYGTNAEAGGPGALDPTINAFDLGEDPLAWGKERSALVRSMIGDLPRHVLVDNSSPYEVTNAFGALMGEYAQAVVPAVKYLGGAYINRDHAGDPNARAPFAAIPKAKQREALDFLVDRVFAGTRSRCRRRSCSGWAPTAGSTSAARRRSTAGSTSRTTSRR